jgi:pimeloyl-ACP methyl ester carboxylesterase
MSRRLACWKPVLAIPILCLAFGFGGADRPQPPPLGLKALTPEVRGRIDRAAADQQMENFGQDTVNLAGNATAFLISQTTLPAREEAKLSQAESERLLARNKVLPAPAGVQRVWDKLLAGLPPHLKPPEFNYRLVVLAVPDVGAFTPGGGQVFITQGLMNRLLQDPERGEAAVALVLAQQLGHIGLGHCRRGWQLKRIQEELQKPGGPEVDHKLVARVCETCVQLSGPLTYFLYSRAQHYEADLFAWQLCRNCAIDLDSALDALRLLAVLDDPRLATDRDYRPRKEASVPVVCYYLSEQPEPLRRLKRLFMERDGVVESEKEHGLFLYQPATGELTRCGNRSVKADSAPIIFLHGLRGDNASFKDFMTFLSEEKETAGRPLLLFRCPNNDSLARNGKFLERELARVGVPAERAAFICHSAGGLVFRYYAEKLRGRYGQAFLLATPNLGSAMTSLKYLVDVAVFTGALRLGLPEAIAQTLPEGRGQINYDIHPDSLFLRYLGYSARDAARYQVIYGRWLPQNRAFGFRLAFAGAKRLLRDQVVARFDAPWLKEAGQRLVDDLQLPDEVLNGDGVVTVRSAALQGAGKLIETPLDHMAIKQDPDVMRQVLEALRGK